MTRTRSLTRRRRRDLLVEVDADLSSDEVEEALTWSSPRRLLQVADGRLELPDFHPALQGLLRAAVEDVQRYEEAGWDRQHSLERLRSHLKHIKAVLSQDWVQEGLEREPELVCGLIAQLVVQSPVYEDEGVVAVSDPLYRTSRRRRFR